MEQIHGITFRDYACASANLASGMTEDKICEVFGIESPQWQETMEFWNNKMAELPDEDMMFFSTVFANPKQGRFENVEGAAAGPEEVLAKYPEWSDTIKMEMYMSEASNVGIEPDFDKEFGISIAQYSQLAMHWSTYFNNNVSNIPTRTSEQILNDDWTEDQIEAGKLFTLHGELRDKWEAHYKEVFKGQGTDLSDDIEF